MNKSHYADSVCASKPSSIVYFQTGLCVNGTVQTVTGTFQMYIKSDKFFLIVFSVVILISIIFIIIIIIMLS